jgi:hypothetical protein
MSTLPRVLLAITTLATGGAAAGNAADQRALRFGQLWDGTRLIPNAVVVVEGERIVEVRNSVPAGVQAIDLRQYTGLPG